MNIEELKMVVELLGGLGDKAFTAFIIYVAANIIKHLVFGTVMIIVVKIAAALAKTAFSPSHLVEIVRDTVCPGRFRGDITADELRYVIAEAHKLRQVYEDHERNKAQSERQPYCES